MHYGNAQKNHTGQTISLPEEKAPQVEVDREIMMLRESIESLAIVVGSLNNRLQPVVLKTPQPVGTVGGQDKEQGCYSDLGQSINGATAEIRSQVSRLYELMHSLAI